MALTVADYVKMYWPDLKTTLDGLNANIFDELVADSANIIAKYNTSHLTTVQIVQTKALILCSQAAVMSSIPGFEESKFLTTFKHGSVTETKPEDVLDYFTEEIKQYIPNYNNIAVIDATVPLVEVTYRKNTAYLGPRLDQRDRRILTTPLSEVVEEEFEGDR